MLNRNELTTTTTEKKARKKKDCFNVAASKRLEQFKAKRAKQQKDLQKLQVIADKQQAEKKAKKARKLTPAQKAKRDKNVQECKADPIGYLGRRTIAGKKSRYRQYEKDRVIKQRQTDNADPYYDFETFLNFFPDDKSAWNDYKEKYLRVNGNPVCPHCRLSKYVSKEHEKRRNYNCGKCRRQFNIRKRTPFQRSRIPFRRIYGVIYLEIERGLILSVKEAAHCLQCSMKSAHAMLWKIRATAFVQDTPIAPFSKVIIDTMEVCGDNRNRPDYLKKDKEEIYEFSKHVLSMKTIETPLQHSVSLAFVIAGLTTDAAKPYIEKYIPNYCTIGSDYALMFKAAIKELKEKGYKHERYNHNAGEHGRSDAESNNASIGQANEAHKDCLSKHGLQMLLNVKMFQLNNRHLSMAQKFDKAVENICRYSVPAIDKKLCRRQSTFVRLVTAMYKHNPDRPITETTIREVISEHKDAITYIKIVNELIRNQNNDQDPNNPTQAKIKRPSIKANKLQLAQAA